MINSSSNKRLWYLSGGMQKFGAEEIDKSNNWREDLKNRISSISDGNILAFNPNEHFSMLTNPETYTDREVMNLDIYKLRKSELIIYSNNDPKSRGSMIELGIGYERQIPIFTLNEDNNEIHCWVKNISEKIFNSREELILYLQEHYVRGD